MLTVEKLVCRNQKYHVDCHWRTLHREYRDKTYFSLKNTLLAYSAISGTAYRIRHNNRNVILIIKLGHDGHIFLSENPPHIKTYA